jgi:hypothetical protein
MAIKRRWSITAVPAPHGCAGIITEQPIRSASPSAFVDMRKPTHTVSPLNVAMGTMMLALAESSRRRSL